jgi:hypothetical protein
MRARTAHASLDKQTADDMPQAFREGTNEQSARAEAARSCRPRTIGSGRGPNLLPSSTSSSAVRAPERRRLAALRRLPADRRRGVRVDMRAVTSPRRARSKHTLLAAAAVELERVDGVAHVSVRRFLCTTGRPEAAGHVHRAQCSARPPFVRRTHQQSLERLARDADVLSANRAA